MLGRKHVGRSSCESLVHALLLCGIIITQYNNHRNTEHPELERTHKDDQVQILANNQTFPMLSTSQTWSNVAEAPLLWF